MWARSVERPSLVSIMAEAKPFSRRTRPSSIRGSGKKCLGYSRGFSFRFGFFRICQTAAAEPPNSPLTYIRSPGRAPDRNTASPFGTVPTTTISARTPFGDSAVSPPARVTPYFSARLIKLRAKRPTQLCGRLRGIASERNAATGSPAIAAMSLSPRARHRCPTDSAECQSRRK